LLALLVAAYAPAASRFERFDRDLARIRDELRIPKLGAVIVESGRVVWRKEGAARGAPLDQGATAVRVMQLVKQGKMSLDDPVAFPKGATVRQVLSHTADGTPGEEYLYNHGFLESLKHVVGQIQAPSSIEELIQFADALDRAQPVAGLFRQTYSGERLVWDFAQDETSSTLFLRIPARGLTLIVVANSTAMAEAAHFKDGNVARSDIALAFLEDIVFGRALPRDEMENRALDAFYSGNRQRSANVLRRALEKFPELASSDDLTLLRLMSQLDFSETEAVATVVLEKHPHLPPAWFYYGFYLERQKRYRESAACFEQITEHEPPWHSPLVVKAKKELSTLE
jgi:Beta-lactamase